MREETVSAEAKQVRMELGKKVYSLCIHKGPMDDETLAALKEYLDNAVFLLDHEMLFHLERAQNDNERLGLVIMVYNIDASGPYVGDDGELDAVGLNEYLVEELDAPIHMIAMVGENLVTTAVALMNKNKNSEEVKHMKQEQEALANDDKIFNAKQSVKDATQDAWTAAQSATAGAKEEMASCTASVSNYNNGSSDDGMSFGTIALGVAGVVVAAAAVYAGYCYFNDGCGDDVIILDD